MFYDTDRGRLEERLRAAGLAKLTPLIRPTIGFRPGSEGTGRSRLGGRPDLAAEAAWPASRITVRPALLERLKFWRPPSAPTTFERPCAFVGQIDLATLPGDHVDLPLPCDGLLLVFHDAQEFWPVPTAPAWALLHADRAAVERPLPSGVAAEFPETALADEAGWITPDLESLPEDALSPEDLDRYAEAAEQIGEGELPPVRLGGWPWLVQSDIGDEACSAALARGLTGTRGDWRLLLEIGSVAEAGMNWGDSGSLYFQMTGEDMRARRWERAWCEMQCS